MKKFAWFIFFLLFMSAPIMAKAQMFSVPNPLPAFDSIQGVIRALIDITFAAAGLVAVIYLIVGGFRYITSSGNAEAIEGAKATIINSVIGLIVIFIAFLLVNYILVSLHVGPLYQLGAASPSSSSSSSRSPSTGGGGGLPGTSTSTSPTTSTSTSTSPTSYTNIPSSTSYTQTPSP